MNDDQVFELDKPPPVTGHPGEDYNCRCHAEPIADGRVEIALGPLAAIPAAGQMLVEAIALAIALKLFINFDS